MTDKMNGWTPERREAARQRILKNKPWEKSTGPKSRRGKAVSADNARKHGRYSNEMKIAKRILKTGSAFLNDLALLDRYIGPKRTDGTK